MDKVNDASQEATDTVRIKLRSYQKEMLEESLERNIIVAMDTGSGKTHIAIARMRAELERCGEDKLVWFVSPSKALSEQQFELIRDLLPAYQVRSLTGADGVDKWTEKRLWNAALANIRIVVGTPAVLSDALTHGFVTMERLALCVFDEAHRAIGDSPMNTIMRDFYHKSKQARKPVPHILGLTASPVMNNKKNSLEKIEANLDAQATTPKRHREELGLYVHPPVLVRAMYEETDISASDMSPICSALQRATAGYDLKQDPYIVELESYSQRPQKKLEKALKGKTYCCEQLRMLNRRSGFLETELGPSMGEWYVTTCIDRFLSQTLQESVFLYDITEKERSHLMNILQGVRQRASHKNDSVRSDLLKISPKVQRLIEILKEHRHASFRGIIFVEQRAAVAAMGRLLSLIPEIASHHNVGTFVGTSTSSNRKANLADVVELKEQIHDLEDFRTGQKDLMVATNVLEEGIDVSACNVVICFDPPKNLVSFVQRRGRARQKNSKYIIFLGEDEESQKADPARWIRLENEMKEAYMGDTREGMSVDESLDEDELLKIHYHVESTGALLTAGNAKAHLYHFCAVSTRNASRYIDPRPEFDTFERKPIMPSKGIAESMWSASVTLPAFVHSSVRSAETRRLWRSEAAAIKEAAFNAYVKLHKAGMVNDNMLPLVKGYGPNPDQVHVDQPSLAQVAAQIDPLKTVAENLCNGKAAWHAVRVSLGQGSETAFEGDVWFPAELPAFENFELHWNLSTTYRVSILSLHKQIATRDDSQVNVLRDSTNLLLGAMPGFRLPEGKDDFFAFCTPAVQEPIPEWLKKSKGFVEARHANQSKISKQDCGLVRVKGQQGRAYVTSQIANQTELANGADSDESMMLVTTFPKRRDFLKRPQQDDLGNQAYTSRQTFLSSECTIDNLAASHVFFAVFLPSILHHISVTLLAKNLASTVLQGVRLTNTSRILETISAPAANLPQDYNRLEYLGDQVLKLWTELQVMAQNPTWPEAYLSAEKDRIVRNSNLSQGALAVGLDAYIITQPLIASKWRPPYVSNLLSSNAESKREMSSKVLADVVEALIGAAFLEGGLQKALVCIRTLLPTENWWEESAVFDRMDADLDPKAKVNLGGAEKAVGHDFNRQILLLEAFTHASYPYNATTLSYERLEFIGDAVLDLVVTPKLFAHPRKLKHWELHRVHEALVNRHLLAFCCMSYASAEDRNDIVPTSEAKNVSLEIRRREIQFHLHSFMHAGNEVLKAKKATLERFERYQEPISAALVNGRDYPWPDLIAIQAEKFMSDIVESVLGALYLDTRGDLSVCETFLERLGVLPVMRRLLDEEVETAFPKERVGVFADRENVKYEVSKIESREGGKSWTGVVRVGEIEIARVEQCGSAEEAEVRAADTAAKVLEDRQRGKGGKKRKLEVRDGPMNKGLPKSFEFVQASEGSALGEEGA